MSRPGRQSGAPPMKKQASRGGVTGPIFRSFRRFPACMRRSLLHRKARTETVAVIQIDMQQNCPATWQGAWTEALFPANVTVKRALDCWKCWNQLLRLVWLADRSTTLVSTHPAKQQGKKRNKNEKYPTTTGAILIKQRIPEAVGENSCMSEERGSKKNKHPVDRPAGCPSTELIYAPAVY